MRNNQEPVRRQKRKLDDLSIDLSVSTRPRFGSRLLEKPTSRQAVEALLFKSQYGLDVVVPTMPPILPWLAIPDERIMERMRKVAPEVIFKGGDPAALRLPTRKEILAEVCEEMAGDTLLRSATEYPHMHGIALSKAVGAIMNDRLDATPAVRRRMQKTVGRDNPFEKSVRSLLHASGVRYRIHYPLPGLKRCNCDLALPRLKIAIFLDGCFWHGCPIHPPVVKRNAEFWVQKIDRNRKRDAQVANCLVSGGWTVLRYWEHERAEDIAQSILSVVNATSGQARIRPEPEFILAR